MSWDIVQLYRNDLVVIAWMMLSFGRHTMISRLPASLRKRLWHEEIAARLVSLATVDYKAEVDRFDSSDGIGLGYQVVR